jgi:hypothetical protein
MNDFNTSAPRVRTENPGMVELARPAAGRRGGKRCEIRTSALTRVSGRPCNG